MEAHTGLGDFFLIHVQIPSLLDLGLKGEEGTTDHRTSFLHISLCASKCHLLSILTGFDPLLNHEHGLSPCFFFSFSVAMAFIDSNYCQHLSCPSELLLWMCIMHIQGAGFSLTIYMPM